MYVLEDAHVQRPRARTWTQEQFARRMPAPCRRGRQI